MRNHQSLFYVIVCLLSVLAVPSLTMATLVADDDTTNYGNAWSGDGGTGFGTWTLSGNTFYSQSTGNGDGDSNSDGDIDLTGDMNGGSPTRSWGLYANNQTTSAVRPFDAAMNVGEIFSISMDNGWLDNDAGVGIALQNSNGDNLFEFFFRGGMGPNYEVNDSSGINATMVPFTDEGMELEFTLTSSNTYSFNISPLNGTSSTVTGSLFSPAAGQLVSQVRLFAYDGSDFTSTTGSHNHYFNSMSIAVPEPSAFLLLGVLCAVMGRSRSRLLQTV